MDPFDESLETDKRFFRLVADRFFNTGDEDYVTSRLLYFNQLYRPFFWACSQALEKHLKCALLVRNKPAYFGHNLPKLFEQLLKCEDIQQPPSVPHEFFDPVLGDQFDKRSISNLIEEVFTMGKPASRYGEYELDWSLRDLLAFDFAIKWLREQSIAKSSYGFPFLSRVDFTGAQYFANIELNEDLERALKYNNFAYFPELPIQEGPGMFVWSISSPQHRFEKNGDQGWRSRAAAAAEEQIDQLVFNGKRKKSKR